jgi:hypothetical protein
MMSYIATIAPSSYCRPTTSWPSAACCGGRERSSVVTALAAALFGVRMTAAACLSRNLLTST